MALWLVGSAGAGCGNTCETPLPLSCCVGGCTGATTTPATCGPGGWTCPAGSVAPGDCPSTPPFCSGGAAFPAPGGG